MTTVTITEEPLAFEDLLAIADGAQVALSDEVRAVIEASRAVVDRALVSKAAVYGLTTQVGHGKDTRLTEEEIRREQMFLVMTHSGVLDRRCRRRRCAQPWLFASMGSPGAAPAPRLRPPTCWRRC